MHAAKRIYRVARSVVFSLLLAIVVLYGLLYAGLAIPTVQDKIRGIAEKELSNLLGGKVEIGRLDIVPFSELRILDISISPLEGTPCIECAKIGAGIDLWKLLATGRIDISYAEISGLRADISQKYHGAPLNIQFLLDALSSKEKNKLPTHFDLQIRKATIRNSSLLYSKLWVPEGDRSKFNPAHIHLTDLNGDIIIPHIDEKNYNVEINRLSFRISDTFIVKSMDFIASIGPQAAELRDFSVDFPSGSLRLSDIFLQYPSMTELARNIARTPLSLGIESDGVSPADFAHFFPLLQKVNYRVGLNLKLDGEISREMHATGHIKVPSLSSRLDLDVTADSPTNPELMRIRADKLNLTTSAADVMEIVSTFSPGLKSKFKIPAKTGRISLKAKGACSLEEKKGNLEAHLSCGFGELTLKASKSPELDVDVSSPCFDLSQIVPGGRIGNVSFDSHASIIPGVQRPLGEAGLYVSSMQIGNASIKDFQVFVTSEADALEARLSCTDPKADFQTYARVNLGPGTLAEAYKEIKAEIDIHNLEMTMLQTLPPAGIERCSGLIAMEAEGKDPQDMDFELTATQLKVQKDSGQSLALRNLSASLYTEDDGTRSISSKCDWWKLDSHIGSKHILRSDVTSMGRLKGALLSLLQQTIPQLNVAERIDPAGEWANLSFHLDAPEDVYQFFNFRMLPLGPVDVSAGLDYDSGIATVNVDLPYLQQGNNLIKNTFLTGRLDSTSGGASIGFRSLYPTKKGMLNVYGKINGNAEGFLTEIDFLDTEKALMTGQFAFSTSLSKNSLTGKPDIRIDMIPSVLDIRGEDWHSSTGSINISDGDIKVTGLSLTHGLQYINIEGVASKDPDDTVSVKLGGIDLDYVFGILNINYVSFGGLATGEITGRGVMGSDRDIVTRFLNVQDFSYNGYRLGNASMRSWLDNSRMMVGIGADIYEKESRVAKIDGGIWVTRDSLAFSMDADHIDASFTEPFMAAFAKDVKGHASGSLKLFGTFSDIDLTGRLKAEDISLRLLSTNVVYSGSDSVIMNSGEISLPYFRVRDRYGNSAMLSGNVRHKYFRQPSFDFRLTDARQILCYDTSEKNNPVWYGTLFGSGSGHLEGAPGWITVDVDMTTERNSNFTFVLSEKEDAGSFDFLEFTDRRKEMAKTEERDTIPSFLKRFESTRSRLDEGAPTDISLDFRATVTPAVLVTLVMDEQAGDKITARGSGPLQMLYTSSNEDLKMYGKYTLEEGNYNFSLQEIILKAFRIQEGSNIAFNGDPMAAQLDISATYRVNANLTDLDQSFATDRELNRTNVPVDAVLKVSGDLNRPDIGFDVQLPTLTSDVERKVKSLMSTDDLLSRQIIYLLAMNRFYTPEYSSMNGASSTGTELTSVASSTISSQLSNILSQITDRISVAPSFRSDKGDFSDMEVDLGLSSRLLDNRLLINGNFGYRDRGESTQSTQFIGDFDIEYLLNRSGNLRLKAYNRFNDQNYYLRQALTTQGVGIVVRRDFDRLLPFLWRRKEKNDTLEKKTK